MYVSVLASGSSGNSTFVSTDESNILVDAGISARRIKRSLSELGKDIAELDAILITHEHDDHVKGLERLQRFGILIFMRPAVHAFFPKLANVTHFNTNFSIGDLEIMAVKTSHDAADPVGFKIKEKKTLSVFTDLGKYDESTKKAVAESDALVIEANHDIDMLLNGPYPYALKERILGDKGHLSNIDAGLLVKENAGEDLKNVFLAHLSQNNNTEELAMNTFSQPTHKKNMKKYVASQQEMTGLIRL